ncbi:hypothetical protein [Novosphingobium album (ex Hu et al. 2023)]|uniref:Pentapeptide repeat-containing protein n=1 Tax=Novosphingobium album (ex Hu et al. 2023) TaxID=2930093 RepID=A0ABT0AWU8_9SPHN|nr:hypothetical protein [Novosphingobium album (ex Hu et al. 2023)]MCJ2177151.1 hypothetical protein [Novosphingobium album (ex Hu et al. 2023)]
MTRGATSRVPVSDMVGTDFQADCARCAALCCVAFALNDSEMFAVRKEAGEPCPNLDAGCGCRIHGELVQRGFRGCTVYDCLGAGPRVTQDFFQGRSWQDDPSLLDPMCDAFRVTVRAHKLLFLLRAAGKLDLSEDDRCELGALQQAVDRAGTSFELMSEIEGGVHRFLRGLRGYVENPG